jgi:hypothetical protein
MSDVGNQQPPRSSTMTSLCSADMKRCLQIQVYFPVISQPGFGLVRTVVKDNNDTDRGQESVRCHPSRARRYFVQRLNQL